MNHKPFISTELKPTKAAREYLATEPSGERAELIERLRSLSGMVSFGELYTKAADMLEADARPKQVNCQIYGHVVGACVECNTHIEAQQAKRLPMTDAEKSAAWITATIEMPSHENCYLRGMIDAEAHHGITPANKPTDDEPEDLYALALKADNWGQP